MKSLRLATSGVLLIAAATMIVAPSDARIGPLIALIALGVGLLLFGDPSKS